MIQRQQMDEAETPAPCHGKDAIFGPSADDCQTPTRVVAASNAADRCQWMLSLEKKVEHLPRRKCPPPRRSHPAVGSALCGTNHPEPASMTSISMPGGFSPVQVGSTKIPHPWPPVEHQDRHGRPPRRQRPHSALQRHVTRLLCVAIAIIRIPENAHITEHPRDRASPPLHEVRSWRSPRRSIGESVSCGQCCARNRCPPDCAMCRCHRPARRPQNSDAWQR